MYGWDSYFIIVGLLRDGRYDLARGMVENFFFEIDNYGGILNANRTYFFTRSQPPFLSSMVLAVYEADKDPADKEAFLKKAYPYIEHDYKMWTSGEKLAGDTGFRATTTTVMAQSQRLRTRGIPTTATSSDICRPQTNGPITSENPARRN